MMSMNELPPVNPLLLPVFPLLQPEDELFLIDDETVKAQNRHWLEELEKIAQEVTQTDALLRGQAFGL